jgi:hypothetical protein
MTSPLDNENQMESPAALHGQKPPAAAPDAAPVVSPPALKRKKIAIIGTAPQWQMAPFDNPEYEIWGILGVVPLGKRLTRLYELHDAATVRPMIEKPPHQGKYWDVARSLGANYITRDPFPEAPEATRFDFQGKLAKYGPYFASSCAWMLADAIDQNPEEIAIYGVNMAHDSEYGYQKPSCMFMLGYAKAAGIRIVVPSSSELGAVPYQYGLERPPRAIECFRQKKAELQQQLQAHQNNFNASQMGMYGMQQALEIVNWFEQNWHTPDKTTVAELPPPSNAGG